jgi:hypothetical protein
MKIPAIVWAYFLQLITSSSGSGVETFPICKISQSPARNSRVITVGDVHGAFGELMTILEGAGITDGTSCEWLPQSVDTTLVQMGGNRFCIMGIVVLIISVDIVDRGAGATEAWECLDKLQQTVPNNSRVVRLVGNHGTVIMTLLYV